MGLDIRSTLVLTLARVRVWTNKGRRLAQPSTYTGTIAVPGSVDQRACELESEVERSPSFIPNTMSSTSAPEIPTYEPKPSLKNAAKVGLQAGIVGTFVSTVQNALGTHSHGAAGFLTRTGGTIGVFGTF
jgi:hypothetical protein